MIWGCCYVNKDEVRLLFYYIMNTTFCRNTFSSLNNSTLYGSYDLYFKGTKAHAQLESIYYMCIYLETIDFISILIPYINYKNNNNKELSIWLMQLNNGKIPILKYERSNIVDKPLTLYTDNKSLANH